MGRSAYEGATAPRFHWLVNAQEERGDAEELLGLEPDLIILCAGAIETRLGEQGLPLLSALEELTRINYLFPAQVVLIAAERAQKKPLTIAAIGSIADGSPSCFGPLYHASKSALHHFYTAVAPIAEHADPRLRVRLYRPGVILGPLSWAPVNRLNEKGYRVRAKRCQGAPEPSAVALKIIRWLEGSATIGSDREPLSFLFLKMFFGLAPGLYARMQKWAWRKASRWGRLSSAVAEPALATRQ